MQNGIFLFLLFFVLLPTPLTAASTSAYFDAGNSSYHQGNYPQALDYFKRAEASGMRDARLDYNLGSVYYRLGEYENSRRYFEKLTGNPDLGALAFYNLALIEHKLGRDSAAIELFEKSAALTADANLEALAQKQIKTLRAPESKTWLGYVAAYYGYDSNITLLPSSSASGESGDFVQLLALADWEFYANNAHNLHASLLYLSRDYSDGSEFDDDSVTLTVENRYRLGDWQLDYGFELGQSTFGGDDYLASTGLQLDARKTLSSTQQIRLQFKHEEISSRSDQFDFLDGSMTRLRATYRKKIKPWEYRYIYEQEFNDRQNTPLESFSPTRNRLGARIFNQLSGKTKLGALIDFRLSEYRGVPSQERKDERTRIRIESEHKLTGVWSIQAELTYIDNRSSEEISEYHQYQGMISINAIF